MDISIPNNFSDLILKFNKGELHTSKYLMCFTSKVMNDLLHSKEFIGNILYLENDDYHAFTDVLTVLLNIGDEIHNFSKFFTIAHKYEFNSVLKYCKQNGFNFQSIDECLELYYTFNQLHEFDYLPLCEKYILKHINQENVIKIFNKLIINIDFYKIFLKHL